MSQQFGCGTLEPHACKKISPGPSFPKRGKGRLAKLYVIEPNCKTHTCHVQPVLING
jgi:hypothetical protein